MGITVSTLGLASLTKFKIPDHLSGEKVSVNMSGRMEVSKRHTVGHPIYQLIYESGFRCGVRWKEGQAVPAYCPGIIPFYRNGLLEKPSMCLNLKNSVVDQKTLDEIIV